MSLENLLHRLLAEPGVTAVTAEKPAAVTPKPAPALARTPVTAVTAEKGNVLDPKSIPERSAIMEHDGGLRRDIAERLAQASLDQTVHRMWLIHYPDSRPIEVSCCPGASHAQIMSERPGAIGAEPLPDGGLPEVTQANFMNDGERDLYLRRMTMFTEIGVDERVAEMLANKLTRRDRLQDTRISCGECAAMVRGQCVQGRYPAGGGGIEALHRCVGFVYRKGARHD